jgi:TPR repeat protein
MDKDVTPGFIDRIHGAAPDAEVTLIRAEFDRLTDLASGARLAAVGDDFREGSEVRADLHAAFHCYQLAADLGDADAMNNLGSMCLNGIRGRHAFGPPQEPDTVLARKWYEAAARKGHPVAQYNLGKLYLHGKGVAVDYAAAAHWIGQAALQGYLEAVCYFGTMHRFGQGVDADLLQAAQFHVIAAAQGDVTAHGNLCDYRDELFDLALNGSAVASYALSRMFREGLGVESSMPLAWALARWAREFCQDSDACGEALASHHGELDDALQPDDRQGGDRQFDEWSGIFGDPGMERGTSNGGKRGSVALNENP